MTATSPSVRATRWAGLLTGLGLAVAAFVAWQIPASGQALGADITIVAAPAGEVTVSPLAPTLAARGLRRGQTDRGEMKLTNITGSPLAIRFRALPSSDALDSSAVLTISDRGRVLVSAPLTALRKWSRSRLRLPVQASRRLLLSVGLGLDDGDGDIDSASHDETAGQVVDVSLELDATAMR